MPQNTLMKKIIIDTHKTKGQHHNDGRVDKVEHVNVDLFTFIDNKMKKVKKFSVHVKDTNGICTITILQNNDVRMYQYRVHILA